MYGHRVRRREFMTAFGCAVLWPFASPAHLAEMPVVGFINSASPGGYPPLSAFLKGLGEAGFVEGRDVAIEYRWAKGDMSACLRSSIILVQRKASVIVATSAPAVMAARGGKCGGTDRVHDKRRSDPTRSCLQR